MRKLIVTADDFAAHPFLDQGIQNAVLAGCVNTVSAFMTFEEPAPKIKSLISNAAAEGNPLHVGVHISLTAGSPILMDEAFTLTYDGGKFMEINKYIYNQVDPLDVYNEVRAQVQKFKDEVGIAPDHLTCHHGIMYLFPDYFKIYLKVAREFGVPIRKPLLISTEKIKGYRISPMRREGLFRGYKLMKNQGIDQVAMSIVSLTRKSLMNKMEIFNDGFVKCPDYFIDTFYRNGREKRLEKIIRNLPRNRISELVVHLGDGDYEISEQERKKYNGINLDNFPGRKKEYDTLVHKNNLGKRIKNDIRLEWASFGDL